MQDIFFSLVAVYLLFLTGTYSKEQRSDDSTSTCKLDPPSGMPGMPGVPGIPGAPGAPGAPGRDGSKGEKGDIGKQGSQCAIGTPGKIGPRGPEGSKGETGEKGSSGIPGNIGPKGLKGSKGENGTMGTRGSAGIPGNIGPRGFKGSKGERGSMGAKGNAGIPGNKGFKGETGIGTKGEKGDAGNMDPRQRANWKQCAWKRQDRISNGRIRDCSFNKLYDNTALKVSYQGNIRMSSDDACCRWYIKFNGNECSGPLPIESVLYTDWERGILDIYRHHSFEGYCENLPRGTVSVELWVGKCSGYSLGNAYTGWNSVSRIMVEEVPPSQ